MRGSITEIAGGGSSGSILAEDGCEFYFDCTSCDGFDFRKLSVGQWVEFEERVTGSAPQAIKIRPCAQPAAGIRHTMPLP